MGGRLRWEQEQFSDRGYPGTLKVDVFSIAWSMQRGDPKPWVLRSSLPGYRSKRWQFVDKDQAKAHAEKVLTYFIGLISNEKAA